MSTQVALVTGAGSGIGAAICHSLSASGYSLVLCGRREQPLTELASQLSTPTLTLTCDVREEAQIQNCVTKAVEKFGRLDVLVNNAGIFQPTPIDETPAQLWDGILSSNLRSAFLMSQAAWPHLKESQGQIMNISSISATMGFAGGAAYCASKFGMNGLTAVLAVEGKPFGIRAFAVCPAQVATPIWEARADEDQLQKMMTAEQIADLVAYLINSPRNINIAPVVISNFHNPWDKS